MDPSFWYIYQDRNGSWLWRNDVRFNFKHSLIFINPTFESQWQQKWFPATHQKRRLDDDTMMFFSLFCTFRSQQWLIYSSPLNLSLNAIQRSGLRYCPHKRPPHHKVALLLGSQMCTKTSKHTHTHTNVSAGLLLRGDPVRFYLSHVGFIWESHSAPDLKQWHMINSAAHVGAACSNLGAQPRL